MRRSRSPLLLAGALLLAAAGSGSGLGAGAQELSDEQLSGVKARLAEGATHSWEIGTRAQALIEFDTPSYSVLNNSALPPPQGSPPSSLDEVISIAQGVVQNRTKANVQGAQPLVDAGGGAAGDPPSIGVAVLLANWTGSGDEYGAAAADQLAFILEKVPKTDDGAISHRTEQVQLWSDFVYMVPPFLAYYGVLTKNQSLVQQAYDQCRLYRKYLVDDDAGGMWKHILLGTNTDSGHWSTGNGWAAAGMLRVLGTIQHSQYAKSMKNQAKDLTNWVAEIHNGIYPHLRTNSLFGNYADDSAAFDDASSTAILASTVYRLALLSGIHTHLPLAEQCRKALSTPASSTASSSSSSSVSASSSSTTATAPASSASSTTAPSTLAHFTSDMWLTPVVNPNQFGIEGSRSPEGQAFVVEMYAAWRDWVAQGSPGANAAARLGGSERGGLLRRAGWACCGVALTLLYGV
ncbi:Six-hairpin glycosidase-like protein [Trametes meyenii]|nr:Six-hairpin glycosidase-like protein [Trametes meyenii]